MDENNNSFGAENVFTLQSIKSRIETRSELISFSSSCGFLLYSPLNQGLKPYPEKSGNHLVLGFYSTVH